MNQPEHLQIGAILFPQMDQADFTGPFEVLSRISDSTFHILAKNKAPIRDAKGLILTPERTLAEASHLDLFLMPGGAGVNTLMEDQEVLQFIRKQAMGAKIMMSVCTGALVYGAAGLLKGRKATTHWASHHLLKHFGATPVDARVVVDGSLVTTASVTAGYDGALRVVEILRGAQEAQSIQLYLQYAPEPPFECGTPETAPAEVLKANRQMMETLLRERAGVVERAARNLQP